MRNVHAFIAISYALHNSPQIILCHTNEPFSTWWLLPPIYPANS